MLYLNEKDLLKIGIHWNETIDNLEKARAAWGAIFTAGFFFAAAFSFTATSAFTGSAGFSASSPRATLSGSSRPSRQSCSRP